eukprot:g5814.t1
MGDSMEEELDRGGVALTHAPGPHAFAGGPPSSIGYQHPHDGGGSGPNLAPPATELANQHHPLRQQHQHQHQHQHQQQQRQHHHQHHHHQWPGEGQGQGRGQGQGWARKRGRGDDTDTRTCTDHNGFVHVAGMSMGAAAAAAAAAHAVRSESPDSEMSSSSGSGGSEGSINRGIKRMRLGRDPFDLQRPQQQQQQLQQQLQQHTLHRGRHPFSAFDRFSAPPQTAGVQPKLSTLHHPRPVTLGRAVSDTQNTQALPLLVPSSTNNADPSRVQRSGSGGLLPLAGAASGNPAGHPHHHQQRSSSFDCVAFPPSTPQPPAQARYVRGIRVEANAPSDVDYSNVNHALRQLHMERRMMATARAAGQGAGSRGAAAGGGWAGGGPSR